MLTYYIRRHFVLFANLSIASTIYTKSLLIPSGCVRFILYQHYAQADGYGIKEGIYIYIPIYLILARIQ